MKQRQKNHLLHRKQQRQHRLQQRQQKQQQRRHRLQQRQQRQQHRSQQQLLLQKQQERSLFLMPMIWQQEISIHQSMRMDLRLYHRQTVWFLLILTASHTTERTLSRESSLVELEQQQREELNSRQQEHQQLLYMLWAHLAERLESYRFLIRMEKL